MSESKIKKPYDNPNNGILLIGRENVNFAFIFNLACLFDYCPDSKVKKRGIMKTLMAV